METTPNYNQFYNPNEPKKTWETPMLVSLDVANTEKSFSIFESGPFGASS